MDDETRTFRQGDDRNDPRARSNTPYDKACTKTPETQLGYNISQCGWMPMKMWNSKEYNVTMVFNMRTFYKMGEEYERMSFQRLNAGFGDIQAQNAGYLRPWPAADVLIISESTWGQGLNPWGEAPLQQMKDL